jgi:predicted nucleic acid-binding Zn ribbon protein
MQLLHAKQINHIYGQANLQQPKKNQSPHRATQYLPKHWLERMEQVRQLEHCIRFSLPEPLKSHCWPSGIQGKELVVITDNSTWATQLRYQQHQILKQVNSDLNLDLKKLRVRVSSRNIKIRKTLPPRKMSQKSAELITQGARSVTDRALRDALLRLAEKGKKTS